MGHGNDVLGSLAQGRQPQATSGQQLGQVWAKLLVLDGTVEIREVEVGAIRGNLVEILSGIRDGDMVVVSGQDALADGQRVVPRQRTPEGEPDAAT